MSDIQEEQKRQYKKAKENDLKATMKPLFPEDVEMICISKDDYDRLYGDLTYENIELQDRINKAIEEINKRSSKEVAKLYIDILKGDNK